MAKANLKKKLQFWGTGRRKKAIARVRLIPAGSGNIVINDRSLEDYFPQGTLQYIVKQPIVLTSTESAYDIVVNVCGGGFTGQAGAIRHGISRALIQAQPELRPALKKEGFLTRDPRAKERKKYGLKKARRAPLYLGGLRLSMRREIISWRSSTLSILFMRSSPVKMPARSAGAGAGGAGALSSSFFAVSPFSSARLPNADKILKIPNFSTFFCSSVKFFTQI